MYPGRKFFFFSSLFYLFAVVLFCAVLDLAIGFAFDPEDLLMGCLAFTADLVGDLAGAF